MRLFSGFSVVVRWWWFFSLLLFPCLLLAACSGLNFGGGPSSTKGTSTQAGPVALAKLHWCGQVLMIFRDERATATGTPSPSLTPTVTRSATPTPSATVNSGATPSAGTVTPVTITDWNQVQSELGFTVYLPATLPAGTCLTSASGTIHDSILGGSFTIGYLLPDHSAITFSEAPVRLQNSTFQCSVSIGSGSSPGKGATPTTPGTKTQPLQVCTGVRDTTNIAFSAHGTTETLQQFFNKLQPNVVWVPAS